MTRFSEQRSFARTKIEVPAEFALRGSRQTFAGTARDISLGGMFIATQSPAPFGAEVLITITLPGAAEQMVLPAVVRWRAEGGMGLQFRALGARETHFIMQIQVERRG